MSHVIKKDLGLGPLQQTGQCITIALKEIGGKKKILLYGKECYKDEKKFVLWRKLSICTVIQVSPQTGAKNQSCLSDGLVGLSYDGVTLHFC